MKNFSVKLLICSMFVIILSTSFCMSSSYALGDIFSQGKGFLEAGKDIDQTINTTKLEETSDTIYNTLLAIAIMVAIIVAMVLGIQFMAASADEKAKVKEALMPFVVGCIVVFGAFTIWKVAVNIGNKAEDSIVASRDYSTTEAKNKLVDEVESGKRDVGQLSNEELMVLCKHYKIKEILSSLNWDVEKAEEIFLEKYKNAKHFVEVYKECKARGMDLKPEWYMYF